MKKRGTGISAGFYGTAAMGGGDPSNALIRIKTGGRIELVLGSTDIGQGCKTVLAQIAAEELGIPYENVSVTTCDTADGMMCLGTMGSRVTYVAGNAVINAANAVKESIIKKAGEILDKEAKDLKIKDGAVFDGPACRQLLTFEQIAQAHPSIEGRGMYSPPPKNPDPATGKWSPYNTFSWGSVFAEVEVDTDTGEVTIIRLVCVYDAGKAINPQQVEGQIEGGAAMSIGQAALEEWQPYYPTLDYQPKSFHDYMIPTAVDMPEEIYPGIYECPSPAGPYGAKGIGEITAIVPPAAIASAINDAIGVWICEMPITPEKILRALEMKEREQVYELKK